MNDQTHELAVLIFEAKAILLVTGAGISTETGIPDFRGPQGVWKTERPVQYQDFVASETARIEYWDQKIRSAVSIEAAQPGKVHRACVELDKAGKVEAIVTQNIDGLHSIAGSPPDKVIEVHGTAREAGCLDCSERVPASSTFAEFAATRIPPRCRCGGLLKPATISFGQALDPMTMCSAQKAAESCDLVIAMGTTLSVYPAAEIPLHAARQGAPYVIINRGTTDHDGSPHVTLRIDADVGETFASAVTAALNS
ncbi:MAG: Sir2 family NAD-dependent protein deacetylase [Actinomycetia bacterium]|nr:Sir2 family NAD-dependent protein deacetylase [Actinomycetes bacterium]